LPIGHDLGEPEMSQRDPRFKPLRWTTITHAPNIVYQAAGIGTVYYIVSIAGYYLALGCNDPEHNAEQYFYLSDAKTVCQLDHEARLKEWMA
jgi:hypothetical protein